MKGKQFKEVNNLTIDGRLDHCSEEQYNVLLLHSKIYDFTMYILPILNKYPTDQRFVLTTKIRDIVYDSLQEVIKYEMSGTISHIYAIDGNIHLLSDLFKISKDTEITVINSKRIMEITRRLNEIGRLVGGIVRKKKSGDNKHKTNKRPYTATEAEIAISSKEDEIRISAPVQTVPSNSMVRW